MAEEVSASGHKKVATSSLIEFIFSLCSVLISASKHDIVYFKLAELTAVLEAFIDDPSDASIFIYKATSIPKKRDDTLDNTLDDPLDNTPDEDLEDHLEHHVFKIVPSLSNLPEDVISAVAVIKEKGQLVDSVSLHSQLQIINLPMAHLKGKNAFETLRALVSLGIAPYFDTLSLKLNSNNLETLEDDSGSLGLTRKKINELALSLQHLQQTVQIPDLLLSVHPKVREIIQAHLGDSSQDLIEFVDPNLLSDSNFLNSLQSTVNKWIKSTQDITQLTHDPRDDSSAKDEVNFWTSMETALNSIHDQLNSVEVSLTLDVLKQLKRFHATISFLSDTGIKESTAVAQRYNQLLRDLPLDEILSASSFAKLDEAVIMVFNHLKKLRVTQYPISRLILLVEAISSDVDHQMKLILLHINLMSLKLESFFEVMNEVKECFETFDLNVKEFTSLARELLRKRSEKFILVKVDSKTTALQERIEYIIDFRKKHNELLETIGKISIANNLTHDLLFAYSAVENIDVTDLSLEGKKTWELNCKVYNERTEKIQNSVIQMLRKLLSETKSSNEMFEIFENFKFLLAQDSIRNAIQEYQSQLLGVVKSDIKNLQNQFLKQSEITKLFKLRDIPPVSATILWARQITQRLNFLTDRCELILGPKWKQYPEGQKVNAELIVFQTKLNTDTIFEAWVKDSLKQTDKSMENMSLFHIVKSSSSSFEVVVTFDYSVMHLFKEVRHLCWLDYDVPHKIIANARSCRKIYPHAIAVSESLQLWTKSLQEVSKLDELSLLLQLDMKSVVDLISSLLPLKWGDLAKLHDLNKLTDISEEHLEYMEEIQALKRVTALEKSIAEFSTKISFLQNARMKFNALLSELNSCPYQFEFFEAQIQVVQNLVNDIIFENLSGIEDLVNRLNDKIEFIIIERCKLELKNWCLELNSEQIPRHEIIIKDQTISIIPALESSKKRWFDQLHDIVNIVRKQSKIHTNSIDVAAALSVDGRSNIFDARSIYSSFNDCIEVLESNFSQVNQYFNSWLAFQSLWDLEIEEVYGTLGEDVQKWILFFQEFKASRSIFDTVATVKDFGFLTIDYEHAQSKINTRYDVWQRQVAIKFAEVLSGAMKDFEFKVSALRKSLELINYSDSVSLISTIDHCQSSISQLGADLKNFQLSETMLIKTRFKFPSDWIHIDHLNDSYSSLTQILQRREDYVEGEKSIICQKIESQSTRLDELMSRIKLQWSQEKPVTGDLVPSFALGKLSDFETEMTSYIAEKDKLKRSSKLLNIHIRIPASLSLELEEISDLKAVWTSIDSLWISLEDCKKLPWSQIVTRDLRHRLDDLLSRSRNLPARIRQYSAFEDVQELIKGHIKANKIVTDLRSESMKEHHWKALFEKLNQPIIPLDLLCLGDVWNLNLLLNENIIQSVVAQANGEKAVEDEINKIEYHWKDVIFELFNFQNKIRFVKRWDVLFQQCNDDLNALSSMQHSIHYKIFEQRGSLLIEKLNKLFRLLDTWIETQKQYVYVEGVFGAGNDIKKLMPLDASRFQSVTTEFFLLLKNIYKSPVVMDALNVPDVQRSMERVLELLRRIRKSLNDYLEKQRELFPRFYFIGNEDLLEIIGNSKDPNLVSKQFKKLFSGVTGAVCEDNVIKSLISDYGETLDLTDPIKVTQSTSLNYWLTDLEEAIKVSLSTILQKAIIDFKSFKGKFDTVGFTDFVSKYQQQIIILTVQIWFTELVESIKSSSEYDELLNFLLQALEILANSVLEDVAPLQRKKYENLVIEFVHQRDILVQFQNPKVFPADNLSWNSIQRFYYDEQNPDYSRRLTVKQDTASFVYGFEYLGVQNRLVYTPLIDRCFLSMTQALNQKIGGSPFGPAGTGKTESVKLLGQNLGKMVLVFCCDESFDFQAMSRILLGVCQVGAWACFDEFNRLEEKILSAVSTQIELIERSHYHDDKAIELLGREIRVNPETAIFVTMNPGYTGRFELPENLKKLFRSFSMKKPDREIIAEVILNSLGFQTAKELAHKLVPFFLEIERNLSDQIHYDFGLRALKSMLISCGMNKRRSQKMDLQVSELSIVLTSVNETLAPKLTSEDEKIFEELKNRFLGHADTIDENLEYFKILDDTIVKAGLSPNDEFAKKSFQLFQMQDTHHGIVLFGESGVGKTALWKLTLSALGKFKGKEVVHHIIDCKVMPKDQLYGFLDPVTRDWTDGVLTSIIRKLKENLRGELSKETWIVFDGDVDPEWIENLNSVLDDNKLLTLPNGERLSLPENLRLVFEVDDLTHATPATVSRCGIVFVANSLWNRKQLMDKLLFEIEHDDSENLPDLQIQQEFLNLAKLLLSEKTLDTLLKEALKYEHIMTFSVPHTLKKLQIMLKILLRKLAGVKFIEDVSRFALKSVLIASCWAFVGDASTSTRDAFSSFLCETFNDDSAVKALTDYTVSLPECEFAEFEVPSIFLDSHEVVSPDVIVPTSDTVKHEDLIYSIVNEHTPLIMCGPPGSGKTMTLLSALRKSPNLEFVDLNFSKETIPQSLLQVLDQHCEYRKTPKGTILVPRASGKWLVVFADEVNLPKTDKYNTQRVICLLREMIERQGFYKNNEWIEIVNIQFVGACNPASDPGRNSLSMRFLKNTLVISVNYPNTESLYQIYGTMFLAIFKSHGLTQYSKDFTLLLIKVYEQFKETFHDDVISPRDLSRIVKGMYVYLEDSVTLDEALRLFIFNSLRVYSDKSSESEIRDQMFDTLKSNILEIFPNRDEKLFKTPLLYTNWLSLEYKEATQAELRSFVSERLRVFCEEELELDLVLYDDLLDHILRIDRVLKQPQGHLILVGPSSSGKTTLTKFVSWMNGFKIEQLSTKRNFTLEDFDEQLRGVLKRAAMQQEKISFIVDESNILETSFLERMNNLLSSCEIPGLFDEDDWRAMMSNFGFDDSEFASYFKKNIAENLHVILTTSPLSKASAASSQFLSSPALINRCVVNWMGDWTNSNMFEVASTLVQSLPVDMPQYLIPETYEQSASSLFLQTFRDVLVDCAIAFHRVTLGFSEDNNGVSVQFTPGHFLKFIRAFQKVYTEKEEKLQEYQRHINVGLEKLRDTVITVKNLKSDLSVKQQDLKLKDKEANEMLGKMLSEQNEAERKKEASIEIQVALEGQEKQIEERRADVLADLAVAEPAVIEALRGVKNIKKEHLNELRAMRNPPESVVLTLESVCALLGYDARSWRDVQLIIRGDTFISDIVNFDSETNCTLEVIDFMEQKYLSRSDYNYNAANRGSKACGPLLQWVEAQISYASILEKLAPLREEVEALELYTNQTKRKLVAVDEMIHDLELSIERYKEDYSALIRETEKIKTEISTVESKVERSMRLMEDLTEERERWRSSITEFHRQRTYLAGDSLLSAAFLTYCGFFDQKKRSDLFKNWRFKLRQLEIEFDSNYKPTTYLCKPEDVELWHENGLANDDLFIENMAIIDNCEDFAFIIDPSNKIPEILSAVSLPKKLLVASFLDEGFVKQLENALRFGTAILIQDGEYFDPIISPILNRETQRVGSRTLVKLGKQLIDCVPGFKMYFMTKNPNVEIPSFAFSRSTVANFSITESSLISQSLNLILRSERPEVEQKRLDLIKLGGEYRIRLRKLEDDLLTSLSTSEGDILENDEVLKSLQTLKSELKEISLKMTETEHVMLTVDSILDEYYSLAAACSVLFDLLQFLKSLNSFYQFSLEYFIDILTTVLNEKPSDKSGDRIQELILKLYQELYSRVSLSLLNQDKVILALAMYTLYHESKEEVSIKLIVNDIIGTITGGAMDRQTCIKDICKNLGEEDLFLNDKFKFLYPLFDALTKESLDVDLSSSFVEMTGFLFQTDVPFASNYDIEQLISSHKEPARPIMLVSPEGYDASFKMGSRSDMVTIAMGSGEGVAMANLEILKKAKEGGWVLIQNVQMAPQWLSHLENLLLSLSPSKNFRLFLTCNLKSSIPVTLLRSCQVLTFENPPGIKLILQETFNSVVPLLSGLVVESRHLYFLLSWYHAVVQERLRFLPIGFTKSYDFNNADFSAGIYVIDQWMKKIAGKKTNIDPHQIPWETVQVLIGEVIYGGKLDVNEDFEFLKKLAKELFTENSFDVTFQLADQLSPPEGRSVKNYLEWIHNLPDIEPPSWIKLDSDVEHRINHSNSISVLKQVLKAVV